MRFSLALVLGIGALAAGCNDDDQQQRSAPPPERFQSDSAQLPSLQQRKAEAAKQCSKDKKGCDAKPPSLQELKAESPKKCSKKNGSEKKGCLGTAVSEPQCGDGAILECHLDVWVRQGSPTTGSICSSFDDGEGFCVGSSTGTAGWSEPGYFPRQGIQTSFTWKGAGRGPRDVDYTADADFTIVQAQIKGNVPASNSATFNVTDATSRSTGGVHWKTVSNGGAPGLHNGPLYIDYSHAFVGSYVHIFGYLVPK